MFKNDRLYFGVLQASLPSYSTMWTTREMAMMVLQNEPHTRTTVNHKHTYTKLENRLSPKGAKAMTYKQLGTGDTPEINASVKGQN